MNKHVTFFNEILTKSLATVDSEGNPNVCPCGSARMLDENKICALSGYFDKTLKNLKNNAKAVFLAERPLEQQFIAHFEQTGEMPYPIGYRYYCTLTDISQDEKAIEPWRNGLAAMTGNRIANKINLLLTFELKEIREIGL
jgi:hypothetical protein